MSNNCIDVTVSDPTADGWVQDARTGKSYLVLNTTTMAHGANQEICLQHGGILPEPRSQVDNDFLNSLNTDMFLLGLRDVETEDSWQWDSDGTPVLYTNWRPNGSPNGGLTENCAFVYRNKENLGPLWGDLPCLSDSYMERQNKNLICQRNTGMCLIFSIHFGPSKMFK